MNSLNASTPQSPRVSLLAEIPEELHEAMATYLESHPGWSHQRLFTAALSMFLLQSGHTDRSVNRLYLDTVFDYAN